MVSERVELRPKAHGGSQRSDDRTSALSASTLSVVIPTKNEVDNIEALVGRLERAVSGPLQIVFVDDSDDDTATIIEEVGRHSRCHIDLIHRAPGERMGGLGGAVVAGLRAAAGAWVCVMDADLQHPPEMIPRLVNRAKHTGADLVVASRYCDHGHVEGLSRARAFISRAAIVSARLLFPSRLKNVSDPLTGFFLVRKEKLHRDSLQPRGFKILLEILIRHTGLLIKEVGFAFGKRHSGRSKGTLREGMVYCSLLWHLRFDKDTLRFLEFLAVGASGLVVNIVVVALATQALGLYYLLSAVVGTQASTLWNFALSDRWVFSDRHGRHGRWQRLGLFMLMNNAAFLLRGPMIYLLTSIFYIHYLASTFISLIALTTIRYALSDVWIWGGKHPERRRESSYSYDIHGIVTVRSDAWLPELQQFLVDGSIDAPTISVSIGKSRRSAGHSDVATPVTPGRRMTYREWVGPFGFWIDVAFGDTIHVSASRLLLWSPHVLYTNVVEPILRWTFVEKGYALVHGACIAFGENAYLVTARTDTGKTTTVLRMLSRQRRATDTATFLSDDLTLIDADGRVLTYPKPLTISRHTVAAINVPSLSRRERLGLIFQSRLHSRKGRRAAFWLAHTRLPVATINAIVQLVVPPPKFLVEQLVPRVKAARESVLSGLFIIERGDEADVSLSKDEALEILMRNCEDAYGFPPYEKIEGFLHGMRDHDLRSVELGIVASALGRCDATVVHSFEMDWAERIATAVQASVVKERQVVAASIVDGAGVAVAASTP